MKKIWERPVISKIPLKQFTLSGSGSKVEQNSGQGAGSKRT